VRPPKEKSFFSSTYRGIVVENRTNRVRRFCDRNVPRPDCYTTFPLSLSLTPFDRARRSDDTGRLHARRRIGY